MLYNSLEYGHGKDAWFLSKGDTGIRTSDSAGLCCWTFQIFIDKSLGQALVEICLDRWGSDLEYVDSGVDHDDTDLFKMAKSVSIIYFTVNWGLFGV